MSFVRFGDGVDVNEIYSNDLISCHSGKQFEIIL